VNQPVAAIGLQLPRTRPRAIYYIALVKPRVLTMVLVATLAGFYLGASGHLDLRLAMALTVGTAMAAGGTFSLNQYMERDSDARMKRTRTRPLPAGNLYPAEALWFGMVLAAGGLIFLCLTVNVLSAAVTASIAVSYLVAYTPLKRVSSLSTAIGAIPGALPPVAGWAAVRGAIDAPAWVLFAIMYIWQLPHTLAIAQLYREDYTAAGIKLLGIEDTDGRGAAGQVVINTLVLMIVALLPTLMGFAGITYLIVALALGGLLLSSGFQFAAKPDLAGARRVMVASLIYLPVVLLVMVLDKI
jgi:protoheme IX farnesyltransferase